MEKYHTHSHSHVEYSMDLIKTATSELIRRKCQRELSFERHYPRSFCVNAAKFHHVHSLINVGQYRSEKRTGAHVTCCSLDGTMDRIVFDRIKYLSGSHLMVKSCVINHDKVVVCVCVLLS